MSLFPEDPDGPTGLASVIVNNSIISNIEPVDFDPSENFTVTLSCAVRSIETPFVNLIYPSSLTTAVRSIQAMFYLAIYLLSIILNILVISLVAKCKKLQTRSTLCALQIIVLDLLYTATVYLIRPISAIADKWLFGEHICIMSGYIFSSYSTIRLFLMFIFAVDRFLAVFFSFTYPKHSSKIIVAVSVFSWSASLVYRGVALPWGIDCYAHISFYHTCSFFVQCSEACLKYSQVSVVLLYVPAVIFPAGIYASLYYKARRIENATESESRAMTIHREEWKPTVTFFLLYLCVVILIIPNFVATIAIYASYDVPPVPLFVFQAALQVLATFPLVADPIMMLRDGNFRDVLKESLASIRCKLRGIGYQREEDEVEVAEATEL